MAAAVDPNGLCGLRKRRVGRLLPQQPHPVARPLLGQHRHPPAGPRIAVTHDQVHMRVGGILPGLVDGGEPRRPPRRQPLGEAAHELAPLPPVELERQGDGQLVDDAGVLAVGPLLRVQPRPCRTAFDRHPGAAQISFGIGPGDVADVRPRRPRRVGAPADRAHVQAVDRDACTHSSTTSTAKPFRLRLKPGHPLQGEARGNRMTRRRRSAGPWPGGPAQRRMATG